MPKTADPPSWLAQLTDAALVARYEAIRNTPGEETNAHRREVERRAELQGAVWSARKDVVYRWCDVECSIYREGRGSKFIRAKNREIERLAHKAAQVGAAGLRKPVSESQLSLNIRGYVPMDGRRGMAS